MFDPKKESDKPNSEKHEQQAKQLLEAVLNNQIAEIKHLIEENNDLLNYVYPKENKNILLIACTSNGVKTETVSTLLDLNADPKSFTEADGWEALHWSASKVNYDVLKLLLERYPNLVNVLDKHDNNALHILIRYGDKTHEDFEKCIRLLVANGINVGQKNKRNKDVLDWAKKKKLDEDIIELIQDQFAIADEYRSNVKLKGFKAEPFVCSSKSLEVSAYWINSNCRVSRRCIDPLKHQVETRKNEILSENEGKTLLESLQQEDTNKFLNFKNGEMEQLVNYADDNHTLLQLCCEKELTEAAIHLVNKGADVHRTSHKNTLKPIVIAAKKGNKEIFEALLKKYTTITAIPKELLPTLLKNIDREHHNNIGCYEVLIERMKREDPEETALMLNEGDQEGNTALHHAVLYAEPDTIEELLSLGASLGAKNNEGKMPIHNIELETLRSHLDNCVIFDPKHRQIDGLNFRVKFDYRSLVPPYLQIQWGKTNREVDVEASEKKRKAEKKLVAETEVLYAIEQISKELLNHPVITALLYLKYRRIDTFYMRNLIVHYCFVGVFLSYFIAYFNLLNAVFEIGIFASIFRWVTVFFWTLFVIKELFEVLIAPIKYLKDFENYLEILIAIFTPILLFDSSLLLPYVTEEELSSVMVLLLAFNLTLTLGHIPEFSTNIFMFRKASYSFYKFLVCYSLPIFAFAISFCFVFNTHRKTDNDELTASFNNLWLSGFKTIIMLTGEFDSSNINFDSFPVTAKLIFAAFIFTVAIILLNLINGLAVSDAQTIKNDAKLIGYQIQVHFNRKVESVVMGKLTAIRYLQNLINLCFDKQMCVDWEYKLGQYLANIVCIFPKYFNYEITFYPRKDGLVDISHWKNESGFSCTSEAIKLKLEKSIVLKTNEIIHAKTEKQRNNQFSFIRKKQEIIESKLEDILKIVKDKI